MIIINDTMFDCSLMDILTTLQTQLRLNNIPLLSKIIDGTNDIQVCCPYHNERRPSAGITKIQKKKDGKIIPSATFHCFSCGETHTLQEMISFCLGYTDDMIGAQGWKWLCRNFLTVSVETRKPIELDFSRDKKKEVENVTYVSEEELDSYRYYHPYWEKRGITEEWLIELFDIGYDCENQMITMPNLDKNGNCLFVAKRSVNFKYFTYPKDVSKCCYGIYQLYQLDKFPKTVWVTESMIDVLRLWQLGIYGVALNGLGNQRQMKELREMPCRLLIIATDMDKAGRDAYEKIKNQVKNKMIQTIDLPNGRKDIGDCTDDEIMTLVPHF